MSCNGYCDPDCCGTTLARQLCCVPDCNEDGAHAVEDERYCSLHAAALVLMAQRALAELRETIGGGR